MSSFYRVIASDVKDKEVSLLPYDIGVRFRSSKRAFAIAKRLHSENRSVVVTEHDLEGWVATWEYEAGLNRLVFDCREVI